MTTNTDPLMKRFFMLSTMAEIPNMAEYAKEWQKLAADAHAQERFSLAETCVSNAKRYAAMDEGNYTREIVGSFSTVQKKNPLEQLIDDCLAMDITNQIATFGDAFLPNRAAEEYRRLKSENTTDVLENVPAMDPAEQDR